MSRLSALRVVYYAATSPFPDAFLGLLCDLAHGANLHLHPWPAWADLVWSRHNDPTSSMAIRVTYVGQRLSSGGLESIEDLVAMETDYDDHNRNYTRDLEAIKAAEVFIYVVDDQAHRFNRYVRHLDTLRADLRAAGRTPDDVPVVIQINHPMLDGVATRPTDDLVGALPWPRAVHVESCSRERRGFGEALDRAIDLHEELGRTRAHPEVRAAKTR